MRPLISTSPPGRMEHPSTRWRPFHAALLASAVVALATAGGGRAWADVTAEQMTGVPLLPIPTYEETGLPAFTMPAGATALDGSTPTDGSATTGTGATGDGATGDGTGTGSSGDGASQNAQTVGITSVSLAAACQIEASGCQTNPASSSTTITGTFQMLDSTYTSMMNSALARNPSLAANVVPGLAGKLDPATESIAAAEYQRQGAVYLQAHDIPNPTVLDVRGYYNFGPGNAVAIAQAGNNELMSSQISGLSAAQLKANGINPETTTVGQWRASVTEKVGGNCSPPPLVGDRL